MSISVSTVKKISWWSARLIESFYSLTWGEGTVNVAHIKKIYTRSFFCTLAYKILVIAYLKKIKSWVMQSGVICLTKLGRYVNFIFDLLSSEFAYRLFSCPSVCLSDQYIFVCLLIFLHLCLFSRYCCMSWSSFFLIKML